MESRLKALATGVTAALPSFITNPSKSRRARNFRVEKIRALLGAEREPGIAAWLAALRRLMRRRMVLLASARKLSALIAPCVENPERLTDTAAFRTGFAGVAAAYDLFAVSLKEFDPLEKTVSAALKAAVDADSDTAGWQELITLQEISTICTLHSSTVPRRTRSRRKSSRPYARSTKAMKPSLKRNSATFPMACRHGGICCARRSLAFSRASSRVRVRGER